MNAVVQLPLRLNQWWNRVRDFRPELHVETLCILSGLYFAVSGTGAFWRAVAATGELRGWSGAGMAVALFIAIAAVNVLLMSLLLFGRCARPMLTALLLVTALTAHFSSQYMVYLDDDMLRNILHTDSKESGELVTWGMLPDLLRHGVLPSLLLWRVRLRPRTLRRGLVLRATCMGGAIVIALASVASSFQGIAGLMHQHKDVRHLIAPANYLVSMVRVATHDKAARARVRTPMGLHATVAGRKSGALPRLLVIVVGETVRAQNWGLNGYARSTTPRLKQIDPINFSDVTACGSATEISLPCMFAPVGRRDYDKDRIAHSQSLLHVLEHAGIPTLWRDNQTGCKGVCEGLAFESFEHGADAALCTDADGCQDEVLLSGLQARVDRQPGDLVVVLHQLGNHGPSYYKRYPPQFRRFLPDCQTAELGECSSQEIINAYDNAIVHTDDFLARVIGFLALQRTHDTAMIYVSDHGESLGENGLFLHGVPYAIAPATQTRVPMVMWLSPGMREARGLDSRCLRSEAHRSVSHDNLFHSVLGLMQVRTVEYVSSLDVFAPCAR